MTKVLGDESPQEKFRRVIATRIKPIRRYAEMVKRMPTQPHYEISSHDAQLVIDELKNTIDPVVAIFEKARDGDLKAKEIKEYTGIDWDKELIDDDGEE
ncbi:unnamed protein product [marine sediment metagenome]|uniref:Uncharacterized protein n=1 Tax=marine sediment metagenome TaxID=412755 RepID=X1F5T3_9ZZZZ